MATTYMVLQRTEDGTWREMQEVEAYSAEMAIRRVINPDRTCLAIPTRKWYMENALEDGEADE